MRYSSMKSSVKSTIAILSIAVTLVAVVPTASAATVQSAKGTQNTRNREDGKADRFAGVKKFVSRMLRRIGTNDGLSVPVPVVDRTNPE